MASEDYRPRKAGRPKAYTDHHFLRAMPNREDEAITTKEIAEKVNCSRAAANNWLRDKVDAGIVSYGYPANGGSFTYYLTSVRPDNWLPKFVDSKNGQMFDIKAWLTTVALNVEKVSDANRVVILAVLRLWQGVLNKDEKFSEVNQEVRLALQKERAILAKRLKMFDSFLQDPLLSGDNEMVSMAEDGMRAVSADITAEQVNDKYNALRAL